MRDVVIVGAKRTAIGKFLGTLKGVRAPDLGAVAIEAALADAGVSKDDVDEVIMGCVVSAGIGQNPARQAQLKAGIPSTVGAFTINKVCGSGLKAVALATQAIPDDIAMSVLVVDNDPEESARATAEAPRSVEVTYRPEPRPGPTN